MHIDSLERSIAQPLHVLLNSSRVAHLLIFVSADSSVASKAAKLFALDYLGASQGVDIHPDVQELRTKGKAGLHTVDAIRQMSGQLQQAPFAGGRKAALIENAERMQPAAANTLLKILEEPPERSLIVLSTSQPYKLLDTILSRGQLVRLRAQRLLKLDPLLDPIPTSYESAVEVGDALHKQILEMFSQECEREDREPSAAQKRASEQEFEGAQMLFVQERSKEILEQLYLSIREEGSQDPACLVQRLLQALDGVERGATLSAMLPYMLCS